MLWWFNPQSCSSGRRYWSVHRRPLCFWSLASEETRAATKVGEILPKKTTFTRKDYCELIAARVWWHSCGYRRSLKAPLQLLHPGQVSWSEPDEVICPSHHLLEWEPHYSHHYRPTYWVCGPEQQVILICLDSLQHVITRVTATNATAARSSPSRPMKAWWFVTRQNALKSQAGCAAAVRA